MIILDCRFMQLNFLCHYLLRRNCSPFLCPSLRPLEDLKNQKASQFHNGNRYLGAYQCCMKLSFVMFWLHFWELVYLFFIGLLMDWCIDHSLCSASLCIIHRMNKRVLVNHESMNIDCFLVQSMVLLMGFVMAPGDWSCGQILANGSY